MNPFRHMLKRAGHEPPVGTWLMSASPLAAEAIGHAGFDWGVIDMEHAPLDMMEVIHVLQALAATRLVPVLRVPWNDAVVIKRVLDAGAQTLMVPFVQDAEEARRAVAATRYPPLGVRGMAGMSRAAQYGTKGNYFASANAGMAVIVQLESLQALEQLEAIATVEGVDALFIGPADLSASVGHPGQTMHPAVLKRMAEAVRRCKAVGRPVGTIGGSAEATAQYRAMGFDYIAVSTDLGLMVEGARAAVASLRAQGSDHVHTLAGGTQQNAGE